MGQEFRYWCPVETWRWVWLMGTLFAVIVTFQYFEIPYCGVPSSFPFAQRSAGNESMPTESASRNPQIFNAPFSGLIYYSQDAGSNRKENFEDVSKDLVPQGMMGSDNSSQIDAAPSPGRLVGTSVNSSLSPVDNVDARPPLVETDHPKINLTADAMPTSDETGHPNITLTMNPVSNSDAAEHTDQQQNATSSEQGTRISNAVNSSIVEALSPIHLSPNVTVQSSTPVAPDVSGVSLVNNGTLHKNLTTLPYNHQVTTIPKVKKIPEKKVHSIAEMKDLLLQSRPSPNSMRPHWLSPADKELLSAKSQIMNAPIVKNDPLLYAPIYRNLTMFKRSYELMEELLKVYIYEEGEKPVFHQPELKGIYASEGWFMKQIEANKKFVTKDSRKAHLFYLPFGSLNLEQKLYVANSHSLKNLVEYLNNYVDMIAARHSFWNRTGGSDHFLVACHDWVPYETRVRMANCIRALCNADVNEGYVFGKDVSLPETNVHTPENPLGEVGGKAPSKRSVLAFFVGSMHGYLRPILLQHWENKDPDMKILGRLPRVGHAEYIQYMKSSKYCICAKGYEVNSPRIAEAIMYECVPVIISDNFVPPFFEILDWESFSVFVAEKDIPNLKNILMSIPERRYRSLQFHVKKVQQHFLWHSSPVKYDIFHMILHSIWYKRVFQMQPYLDILGNETQV